MSPTPKPVDRVFALPLNKHLYMRVWEGSHWASVSRAEEEGAVTHPTIPLAHWLPTHFSGSSRRIRRGDDADDVKDRDVSRFATYRCDRFVSLCDSAVLVAGTT